MGTTARGWTAATRESCCKETLSGSSNPTSAIRLLVYQTSNQPSQRRAAAMKALKDTNKSNPQKSNDSSKEKSTPDTKSRPKRSSQKEKVAAQEKDSDEEMPDAPSETPGGPVDQSGVENTPGGGPVANPGMEKPAEVSFLTCLI